MKLPAIPLVVLDTETTGFVPRVHRVIEYAAVRVEGGKIVDTYDQLFFNEEIPPTVEVLTRIRTEHLNGQPNFEEKRDEILARIPENAVIVGQNILFDIGMLKGEGIDLSERPWIDTSILASLVFPELESYSLGYLSEVLKLNHAPKHRALGDVHATLELLGRCWERLTELTPALQKQLAEIMAKAPAGYRMLFAALPEAKAKKAPAWLKMEPNEPPLVAEHRPREAKAPPIGTVTLREESADPAHLLSLIEAAQADPSTTQWFAVKNLDAFVRRLPEDAKSKLRILYPPSHLLDPEAAKRLAQAETFTADEATLLLKLAWYEPVTRNDLPLHGGEEVVWRSVLACTETSAAYLSQFDNLPDTVLIDHRHFLRLLENPEHPAHAALEKPSHVLLDDASMLEDTATKAFGWFCNLTELRAASTQSELLPRVTDLAQLWVEKLRQGQDVRMLSEGDLKTPDVRGLADQIREIREKEHLPPQIETQLFCLLKILEPENLARRFAWIEVRQDGTQTLQSVPEHVGEFLRDLLYTKHPTTLLIPPGSQDTLREILPDAVPCSLDAAKPSPVAVPVSFTLDNFEDILRNPPPGKTILLIGGRGTIENMYVKYTEALEPKGVTLICQGVGGGQGRMRAEFLAAPAPALWLCTPWMFEGIELPPGVVDRVIITSVPFDFRSHPVLSRRAAQYRDSFSDYFFPRLLHRLFRLLRTFCRFKTDGGEIRILDERIHSKKYGKDVIAYLGTLVAGTSSEPEQAPAAEQKPSATNKKTRKPSKSKDGKGQMSLF
jgi:DNA polymerase III epsilon subunit-like protein